MLTRRLALLSATALIPAGLLAGCSGLTASQVAADIQGAANAAASFVSSLPPTVKIPAKVTTALADLSRAAGLISANPIAATATIGQQVVQDIEIALPALIPLTALIPPPAGQIAALALGALQAFLPAIAGAFGIHAPAAATLVAGVPHMAIENARAMFDPK